MATGHRFRPSEAARIVADVAVALDYAHQMGVIHRDIKPGNLILTRDGSARIADFGIARMESSNLTVDGQFIGTPNFMSPEQIKGLSLDGRSDLFSLGVVLFTLLTGQRPFTGDNMHEVPRRILEQPTPIPSMTPSLEPWPLDWASMRGAETIHSTTAWSRKTLKRETHQKLAPDFSRHAAYLKSSP